MKLSTYVLLILVAISQYLVVQLPWITPQFNTETFLAGNLQMIGAVAIFQVVTYLAKRVEE